jgi:hypothetical protein
LERALPWFPASAGTSVGRIAPHRNNSPLTSLRVCPYRTTVIREAARVIPV